MRGRAAGSSASRRQRAGERDAPRALRSRSARRAATACLRACQRSAASAAAAPASRSARHARPPGTRGRPAARRITCCASAAVVVARAEQDASSNSQRAAVARLRRRRSSASAARSELARRRRSRGCRAPRARPAASSAVSAAARSASLSASRSSAPSTRAGDASPARRLASAWRPRARRVRLGLEAQPRAVAGEAQQPRGVVEEAALVQHAQAPGGEVLERVRRLRRARPARGPPSGTAIALTVKSRRARSSSGVPGAHVRQRARARVGLARGARRCRCARRSQLDDRGAEALVDGDVRRRARVAGQIAAPARGRTPRRRRRRRTSSSRGARPSSRSRTAPPTSATSSARRPREQLAAAGQLASALEHGLAGAPIARVAHARRSLSASRTGMPAAARCALASAIVWRP